jgi:hypothetical protein
MSLTDPTTGAAWTHAEFLRAFKDRFCAVGTAHMYREELRRAKQAPGELVNDYATRMVRLMEHVQRQMPLKERINYFQDGMKPELLIKVRESMIEAESWREYLGVVKTVEFNLELETSMRKDIHYINFCAER